MTRRFVVTEGATDVLLLRSILGIAPDNPDVVFVAAGGWSRADSLARSILVRNEGDVALVVDADSSDPDSIEERQQFLHDSLRSIASICQSDVFLLVPQIESLFFQDRDIAESLIGHSITDFDYIRGQYEPKKVLVTLLGGQPFNQVLTDRLPQIDLSSLQRLPVIQKLQEFLSAKVQLSLSST